MFFRLQVFASESFCRSKSDYVTAVLTGIYPITIRCRVCDLILIGEGYCYTACLMMIFSAWGIPHGGLSLNASGFHHSVKPWFESRSAISCLNPRPLWFVQSYVKYQFGSMPRFHVYLFKGSRPSAGTEMFQMNSRHSLVYCFSYCRECLIWTLKFLYVFMKDENLLQLSGHLDKYTVTVPNRVSVYYNVNMFFLEYNAYVYDLV